MKKEYIIGIIILVLVGASFLVLFPTSGNKALPGLGYDEFPYIEIVNPSGFVNTPRQSSGQAGPITIGEFVGEKVIMLDVMTYSCINCQRTFPYVTSWYEMYKDDGFIVIGIHTPEFAFEKNKANVEEAMERFGINFPVVLDNDYGTWNAYGNRFWPRKYLIDIHGNVVYDHIGEGAYEETEEKILELLDERAEVLGDGSTVDMGGALVSSGIPKVTISTQSPETYFGSLRNEYFGNGTPGLSGEMDLVLPASFNPNTLYLGGVWSIGPEFAESREDSKVVYRYKSQEVYIVADADSPIEIEVWQDGQLVSDRAGSDVEDGVVTVRESKLYKLIKNPSLEEHVLELRIRRDDARFYAFTFG